jgi:hypothetical protein
MRQSGLITKEESRNFRLARFAWPFLFALAILAIAISAPAAVFVVLIAVYAVLTIYLLLWHCPRCDRLFGVKFGLISIAWPFFGQCLHCGSKIQTSGSNSAGTSVGT